jgi:hypothetical protein
MDTNQAIEILTALGTGCDPETGELLDADSVLCRTDVLQALFVAIGVLKKSTSESKSPTLLTVSEAAQKTLGVTVKGGPQRFNQRGWFSVGETIVLVQLAIAPCMASESLMSAGEIPITTGH